MFQANEAGDKSSAELKKELEKKKNDLEVLQSGIQLLLCSSVMLSTAICFMIIGCLNYEWHIYR